MIAPRHADFVLQATSSLNEPVLEGWKRLFFIFLIVAISITILPYIFTEERYEVEAVVLNKWITGDEFSPLYHVGYRYIDHRQQEHTFDSITRAEIYDE